MVIVPVSFAFSRTFVYTLDVKAKKQMAIAMAVVNAKKKLIAMSAFCNVSFAPGDEWDEGGDDDGVG